MKLWIPKSVEPQLLALVSNQQNEIGLLIGRLSVGRIFQTSTHWYNFRGKYNSIIGIYVASTTSELERYAGSQQQCIKSLYTFVLPDKSQKTNMLTLDLRTKRFLCKVHSGPETAPSGSVVEVGGGLDLRLCRSHYPIDIHVAVDDLGSLRSALDLAGTCHFDFVEEHIARLATLPCLINGSLVREDDERKAPASAELAVLAPGLGRLSAAGNTAHVSGCLESRTYYSPKRDSYADLRRAVLRDLMNSLQYRIDHLLIKSLDVAGLPASFRLVLPSRQFFEDADGWLYSSNCPSDVQHAEAERKLSKLLRRPLSPAGGESAPTLEPVQLTTSANFKPTALAPTPAPHEATSPASQPAQRAAWIPPPSLLGALLLLLFAYLMSRLISAMGVPPKPGHKP